MNWPSNALFSDINHAEDVFAVEAGEDVVSQGTVDGVPVDILLDTGARGLWCDESWCLRVKC